MPTEAELRLHRCCFTGHRPEKLNCPVDQVKAMLETAVRQAIGDGFTTFITGMARGVDIWAGQVVLKMRAQNPAIKLVAASPYKGFEERWSDSWKQQYSFLIEWADAVRYICPGYSKGAFQRRNEWMVDRSSRVIAFYNGESGGTRNTILYAESKGVEVVNLLDSHFAMHKAPV